MPDAYLMGLYRLIIDHLNHRRKHGFRAHAHLKGVVTLAL